MQDDIVRLIGRSEEKSRGLGDRPASKGAVIFRRFFMKNSGTVPEFGLDSPSLRDAASDELLGIVNAYVGLARGSTTSTTGSRLRIRERAAASPRSAGTVTLRTSTS